MKKTISLILCAAALFSFCVIAAAAGISQADALKTALADAGLSESQVRVIKCELDYDDGVKEYDIEFLKAEASGYTEYEYEISASSGKIVSKDIERKYGTVPGLPSAPSAPGDSATPGASARIGADAARKAALDAFGLSANEAKLLKLEYDRDDGAEYYEIEYRKGFTAKYSCDVNAVTGEVRDVEIEQSRNAADRIELFLEALGFMFRSLFVSVK